MNINLKENNKIKKKIIVIIMRDVMMMWQCGDYDTK